MRVVEGLALSATWRDIAPANDFLLGPHHERLASGATQHREALVLLLVTLGRRVVAEEAAGRGQVGRRLAVTTALGPRQQRVRIVCEPPGVVDHPASVCTRTHRGVLCSERERV